MKAAIVLIGAFAALANFALFHLATVFPLSWIVMYSEQSITEVLSVQIVGAFLAAGATCCVGWLADRIGRRNLLGAMAVLGLVCSALRRPGCWAGSAGNNVFLLVGFVLLGLSTHGGLGNRHCQFLRHSTAFCIGAALVGRPAWLLGAGLRRWWRWGCRPSLAWAPCRCTCCRVRCALAAFRVSTA